MSQFWKPGTEKPRLVDDEEGGVLFFNSPSGYANIERQRQRLPVFRYRTAILYLVETHATTIVVGETGSGKTTQIPQVCFFFLKPKTFFSYLSITRVELWCYLLVSNSEFLLS